MAEFKIPKFKYKDEPIRLDECYRQLSEMTYQSPVEIIYRGFEAKLEDDIYKAIHSYDVFVDKDELVKALQYDRNQYEKGFVDGCKASGTADVVPRAEVEKIFEEIESAFIEEDRKILASVHEHLDTSKEQGVTPCESLMKELMLKHTAMNFARRLLAELKKKYTEWSVE